MATMKRRPPRSARLRRFARLLAIAVAAFMLTATIHISVTRHRQKKPFIRAVEKHRLALLIPFAAKHNVPYWGVFCRGAAGVADMADFIIVHNGVLEHATCAQNVILINLQSNENLGKHLLRVLDHKNETVIDKSSLEDLMKTLLDLRPYALVEFKPALGYIFQDLLQDYSHWGYTDLDIVFGDLSRWITEDELLNYDIVTYSYGDQHRLYLRGQFTFHKNDIKVNNIWRACKYLQDMDERFADIVKHKGHYRIESAEGCYSKAVLERNDLKIKYSPHAWTDTHDEAKQTTSDNNIINSHGVYLARSSRRQVLYRAKSAGENARLVAQLHPSFWDDKTKYAQKDLSIGSLETMDLEAATQGNAKCMYWVLPEYQSKLCLSVPVASDETMYWINGSLYKQKFAIRDEGVAETAPFFHFQEWKRHYRFNEVASCNAQSPISTFLLTQYGVVPIPQSSLPRLTSFQKDYQDYPESPLGLTPQKWNSTMELDRKQLPVSQYCVVGSATELTKSPCRKFIEWTDKNATSILAPAHGWKVLDVQTDVTLVLTLQIRGDQSSDMIALKGCIDHLIDNLDRWYSQPSVTVIFMSGATVESMKYVQERLGLESGFTQHHQNAFVAAIFEEDASTTASRKSLQNMATDLAPTRWYVIGMELERGLLISNEAAYLALTEISSKKDQRGNVFYLPQFALTSGDEHSIHLNTDIDRLFASRLQNEVHFLQEFGQCSTSRAIATERIYNSFDEAWWKLTESAIGDSKGNAIIQRETFGINDVEKSFLTFMVETTQGNVNEVFRFSDESLILLVDNLSPSDPKIRTSAIARSVEALEGSRCYNGLQLAQLVGLGYQINVLPGAYAVSTMNSRTLAGSENDATRCQLCSVSSEDEQRDKAVGTMDRYAKREFLRIANNAIIWMEYSSVLESK